MHKEHLLRKLWEGRVCVCAPQGSGCDRVGTAAAASQLSALRSSHCRVGRGEWTLWTRDGWQEKVPRCPALEIQGTMTAGGEGVSQACGRHFPGSEELKEDLGTRIMPNIDMHSAPLLVIDCQGNLSLKMKCSNTGLRHISQACPWQCLRPTGVRAIHSGHRDGISALCQTF